MDNRILVEVEVTRHPLTKDQLTDRRVVKAWKFKNSNHLQLVGAEVQWSFIDGKLDYFAGFTDAVILGEVDRSRHMESDRVLYTL